MSIEQKAFLFHYDEFDSELRETLEESLATERAVSSSASSKRI